MNTSRWFSVLLFVAAIAGGVTLAFQRQEAAVLHDRLQLLHQDQRTLAGLRAENARVKAAQVSDAELASLRADHIAAERLQAELESLRASVRKAEEGIGGRE